MPRSLLRSSVRIGEARTTDADAWMRLHKGNKCIECSRTELRIWIEQQDELGAGNLALAAKGAARFGGTVLIEPVSGAPAYPLLTAADALAVVDRTGEPNVALLADLYHLAVNGDDVSEQARDRQPNLVLADLPLVVLAGNVAEELP